MWAGLQEAGTPRPAVEAVVVRIEGALDVSTRSLLQRAIRTAEAEDAHLVVELDTPGGEVELMWQLAGQLDDASERGLVTAAWVHDKALSAGALIAMACEYVYVHPRSTIGAAAPVVIGPDGNMMAIADEVAREKFTAAVRSSFRSWAESHGRPPALAEAMVDSEVGVREVRVEGVVRLVTEAEYDDLRMTGREYELLRTVVASGKLASFSAAQAVEFGLADGQAESLDVVFSKLGLTGVTPLVIEPERSERLASFLASIQYLLLLGGIAGLYVEVKAPGFGLPGLVSIACFGLFLFGQYLTGLADVPHIVAVSLGLGLIAVELFVAPGTLWFGLAGGVLVIGGLVLASLGPSAGLAYALDRQLVLDTSFRMALWTVAAVVLGGFLTRMLPRAPVVGRLVLQADDRSQSGTGVAETATVEEKRGLVGTLGEALCDLRPVGKIALAGRASEEFEARAVGAAIDRGARVRVVEVRSGRLVVEAETPA